MSCVPSLSAPPFRRRLGELAALALLRAIATGAIAVATRDIFVALSAAGENAPPVWLPLIVIALAGVAIALLRWWEQVKAEHLGQDYAAELRRLLFVHIAHLPAGMARRRQGGLSLRFVGDLTAVRAWVAQGVARGIAAAMVIPVLIGVLFHLDAALALGVLVPIGTGFILMLALGPLLLEAHQKLRQRRARLAVDMTERLPVAAHLRHLGRLGQEQARLARRSVALTEASIRRQRRSALIKAIPDAVAGTAVATALWLALSANLPGATAAGILAATGMMIAQMRETAGVWDRYCAWQTAISRCQALLLIPAVAKLNHSCSENEFAPAGSSDTLQTPANSSTSESNAFIHPLGLRFSAVCHAGLGPLSFDISPGTKVGIVGENGSGKSTLLRLAAGLDTPDSGQIETYYPSDIACTGQNRSGRVVLLGSDSPLLAGSVRKALTFGVHPRPRDTVIHRIARRYGLKSVIERLGGLDGSIAEGGRNLSRGECRRILIARAALSDPGLLLLDEPDDALDDTGRRLIRRLVRDSRATVLYVTHHPRQLDAVYETHVLADGQLSLNLRSIKPTSSPSAKPASTTPVSAPLTFAFESRATA